MHFNLSKAIKFDINEMKLSEDYVVRVCYHGSREMGTIGRKLE